MKKELKLKGNFLGPVEIYGRPYEGEVWTNINNIQYIKSDSDSVYMVMANNNTVVAETDIDNLLCILNKATTTERNQTSNFY